MQTVSVIEKPFCTADPICPSFEKAQQELVCVLNQIRGNYRVLIFALCSACLYAAYRAMNLPTCIDDCLESVLPWLIHHYSDPYRLYDLWTISNGNIRILQPSFSKISGISGSKPDVSRSLNVRLLSLDPRAIQYLGPFRLLRLRLPLSPKAGGIWYPVFEMAAEICPQLRFVPNPS